MNRENTEKLSLNSPLDLNGKTTVKNRMLKSAMSEQLGTKDHAPSDGLAVLYGTWARGGIGLNVTGNVMIDRRHLGEPKNVVLEDDRYLGAFEKWAKAGRENNAHIWMQLNHPGKQIPKFLNREPVAPSPIPLGEGLEKVFNTPRALSEEEIWSIVQRFARSAELAKEAGFTGVQIHGAHGYLVSQFLSPHHNQRDDQWGGSPENRRRFLLETVKAIRGAVGPDFPVGVKLNSADFQRGGFTEEESMNVVKALAAEGIDLVEISGGNYEKPAMTGTYARNSTREREAYFFEYAEKVRKLVDVPLAVTGGFRSAAGMTGALQSGAIDMAGIARPLALHPDLPDQLIENPEKTVEIKRPSTGIKLIDKMGMLDITWYEHQLALMAEGKAPNPGLSAWSSIIKTMTSLGMNAFKPRRA